MEWPNTNEKTGKPSTTPTNQSIVLAAADAAGAALPEKVAAFRESIEKCENWRSEYPDIFEQFVRLQAEVSPEVVDAMCKAGLQKAEEAFVFRVVGDEKTVSLAEAFSMDQDPLKTLSYSGNKATTGPTPFELASPHGTDENPLWVTGKDAVAQIDAWKNYGAMEPSAAEYANAVLKEEDASDLVKGKTFCLLGVTSQMGPTHSLLKIPGAHVMGVARGGFKMEQLVEWFEKEGPDSTVLQVPEGGADLLKQVPQIARWIVDTAPTDQPIVLIPLAYMDGEACVRVTVAMDKIVTHVMQKRKDVSLAYLISPATVYAIPKEAAEDAKKRYEEESISLPQLASLATFGNWAKPTNAWTEEQSVNSLAIYNGIVPFQGMRANISCLLCCLRKTFLIF
jgi:hypothetical protein